MENINNQQTSKAIDTIYAEAKIKEIAAVSEKLKEQMEGINDLQISKAIDTISAEAKIKQIVAVIEATVIKAKEVVIVDPVTLDLASNYLKDFKDTDKTLDEMRKEANQPFADVVSANNAFVKSIQLKYLGVIDELKGKISDYGRAQQLKAQEEAKRLQKEADERALKEAEERESRARQFAIDNGIDPSKVKVETPEAQVIIPIAAPKLSQMNTAGIKAARIAKWRIVDETKIPRQYWILDEKTINAIRRSKGVNATGTSYIPGIEFYSEDTIR